MVIAYNDTELGYFLTHQFNIKSFPSLSFAQNLQSILDSNFIKYNILINEKTNFTTEFVQKQYNIWRREITNINFKNKDVISIQE